MAFGVGCRWLGPGGGGWEPVALEGFLDPPCGGGSDALVNGECLLQVREGLTEVAVLQVGLAKSLQGACFFQRRTEVARDRQRLGVVLAGLAGGPGPRRKFAEPVQRLRLAEPVAEVAEQRQGLLVAGGGGGVVPGQLLHNTEAVEGFRLAS